MVDLSASEVIIQSQNVGVFNVAHVCKYQIGQGLSTTQCYCAVYQCPSGKQELLKEYVNASYLVVHCPLTAL